MNLGKVFDDDFGGLRFKYDRFGLLSVVNVGLNINIGYFSIVMVLVLYLDGLYVIFGEVVDGMEYVWVINKLVFFDGEFTGEVKIVRVGVLEFFR